MTAVLRGIAVALAVALAGCPTSAVGSIGAMLVRDGERRAVFVRDVPDGAAAEDAGLLPGDEIVMIDGRYVRELDVRRIRELLRGDVGTAVHLTVVRGEAVLRLRVVRKPLEEQPAPRRAERIEP